MCPRGRPRGQGRPRGLHLCTLVLLLVLFRGLPLRLVQQNSWCLITFFRLICLLQTVDVPYLLSFTSSMRQFYLNFFSETYNFTWVKTTGMNKLQ